MEFEWAKGDGWGNGKREMGNGELAKGEKVWEWGMEKGYGNGQKEKWRMSKREKKKWEMRNEQKGKVPHSQAVLEVSSTTASNVDSLCQ